MSINIEEMIRAQPMGAVVLVGGCDKTVPAQLMGAASADLPAIQLAAEPMLPTICGRSCVRRPQAEQRLADPLPDVDRAVI